MEISPFVSFRKSRKRTTTCMWEHNITVSLTGHLRKQFLIENSYRYFAHTIKNRPLFHYILPHI
jgi:hypothetical protein